MTEQGDRPARLVPAIREVSVIVVGVLLALGGDACWQKQQDSVTARQYLESIQVEARNGILHIDSIADLVRTHRLRTEAVLAAIGSGESLPPDLEPAWDNNFPVHVPLGALESLFETGDQRLIEDRALRAFLATRRAELRSMQSLLDQWTYLGIGRFMDNIAHSTRRRLDLGVPVPAEWTAIPPAMIGPDLIVIHAQRQHTFTIQLQVMARLRDSLVGMDSTLGLALDR